MKWVKGSKQQWFNWAERLRKPWGVRVLFYHGVVEKIQDPILESNFHLVSQFREHVQALRKRRVLSVEEFEQEMLNPTSYRAPAVLITVDDGYANNMIIADVLKEAHLPWCAFLTTGRLGTNTTIWPLEIRLLFLHGQSDRVELLDQSWSLLDRACRENASRQIVAVLKKKSSPARREIAEQICRQFPEGESERLLEQFPSCRMLSWDQAEQLAREGVEIGSHGVEHEIHHASQPDWVRQSELTVSKSQLEERLQRPCRFFSFPNGDAVADSASEVRHAGYELGFTTENRKVPNNVDRYLVPRMAPPTREHDFIREFLWTESA
jgi:peptidoglycan/xylan/chitin deacetylase (PgdA/CDA1 family)